MPGMTVAEPRSMTRAPAGMSRDDPTLVMRSPLIRMTWLLRIAPDLESNKRPARIAMTWSGGARYLPAAGFRAAPPPSCGSAGPAVAPTAAAMETTARVLCQPMESSLMTACGVMDCSLFADCASPQIPSLPRLLEIAQVRRRLVLAGRHQ